MKRVVVDFKKLTKNILDLLVEKYPHGYSDNDVISFRNGYHEVIDCIEVNTTDTIYLVKTGKLLKAAMELHDLGTYGIAKLF